MPPQLLLLEPERKLQFKGPVAVPLTTSVKVKNPTERKISFRIKTDAPLQYVVNPIEGILQPGASTTIFVTYFPEESPNLNIDHKFRIKSTLVPAGEVEINNDIQIIWRNADPREVMRTSLKCMFQFRIDCGIQNGGIDDGTEACLRSCKGDSRLVLMQKQVVRVEAENAKLTEELGKLKKAHDHGQSAGENNGIRLRRPGSLITILAMGAAVVAAFLWKIFYLI